MSARYATHGGLHYRTHVPQAPLPGHANHREIFHRVMRLVLAALILVVMFILL